MIVTKKVKQELPFSRDGFTFELISNKYIEPYTNNLVTEEYERFNAKFSQNSMDVIRSAYLSLAESYNNSLYSNDIRFVAIKNSELVGGISIYTDGMFGVKIGYFVMSDKIGRGIGNEMLKAFLPLVKTLQNKGVLPKEVNAYIHKDNKPSLKIARNNGFEWVKSYGEVLKLRLSIV